MSKRRRAAPPLLDVELAQTAANLFKALSDPTRLRILACLRDGERCVHELVEALEVEQSALSHQLRLLRDRGLAVGTKQGRHVYYRLADAHVERMIVQGLSHAQHLDRGR